MFDLNDVKMMPTDGVDGSTTSTTKDLAELNDESEVLTPDETELEEPEEDTEEPTEETEEPDEEEESVTELHPFDRPSLKTINEKFPDFFKVFPAMRDMYFREAEYSKLFPTIDDAKEAQENNSAFQNIRDDVFNGSGEKFLTAIKGQSPQTLQNFAGKILGTLVKVDQDSFWRAANPLVEDIARSMYKKGIAENNESMSNAAKYLAHYFFGNADVAEGKTTTVPKEQPESDVSRERKEWEDQRQFEFRTNIEKDVRAQLVDLITGTDARTGKSRLDPDDILSPFIKNTIIEKVIQDIGATLQADKNHIAYMDSLWSRAKSNGRTDADKVRIITAYLTRARALAPSLRSKYVSEATGKRIRGENQKRVKMASIDEKMPSNGRVSGSSGKNYNPKSIDYRKTSDYDILNDDIKYKN